MATTENNYVANGSTSLYSFNFPYLDQTDVKASLNGVDTTAFTFANATTIQFTSAPAAGTAIRIYRETANDELQATFYPGSAIRSADLNNNFIQTLYVTQEASAAAVEATDTANNAISTAQAANTSANTALSTANAASTASSSAVSTANAASSTANTALSTANSASSTATTALNTANSASTSAQQAVTTANAASSAANSAVSTANSASSTASTASTNASAAVSTANVAQSTANTASSNASTALSTANTALSTANTANNKADQAIAAVSNSINYTLIANVAAIPSSPSNNTYIEVKDSTGLESFTPLIGLPSGFVGDAGLSVRLQYTTTGSTWNWLNYYSNNPETRYLKLSGGTLTGALTLSGAPTSSLHPATKAYVDGYVSSINGDISSLSSSKLDSSTAASTYLTQANAASTYQTQAGMSSYLTTSTASSTYLTQANAASTYQTQAGMSSYLTTASAASTYAPLSSPSFTGNTSATGTSTAASFIPTSSTVPTNGLYLSGTNTVALASNSTKRIEVDANGNLAVDTNTLYVDAVNNRVGLGTSSPGSLLHVSGGGSGAAQIRVSSSATQANIAFYDAYDSGGNTRNWALVTNKYSYGDFVWMKSSTQGGDPLSGSAAMAIDQSGRVGIGTNAPYQALDVNGVVIAGGSSDIGTSTLKDAAFMSFVSSQGVARFGSHADSTGAYSPIAFSQYNKVGSTERARIDSSGRLLVGTSTSAAADTNATLQAIAPGGEQLVLGRSDGSTSADVILGAVNFYSYAGSSWQSAASITALADAASGANDKPGRLVFSVTSDGSASPTERMRISQNGVVDTFSSVSSTFLPRSSAAANTSNQLIQGCHSATNTQNGTVSFIVYTNGNVQNTNNSYGQISDAKLKENIVDASSQWEDLKSVRVRNFNFKEGQTHRQIGVIAQELEQVSPGLVYETPDRDEDGNETGEVTKGVNYSVLYMKAVKALQEAMERIEILEAKVAALEAQ